MQGCSVGLRGIGFETCLSVGETMDRGQSEKLLPMINGILEKSGCTYKDLGLIAVTVGPGAFTGLRIGLSTARALGVALNIPVAGVTTLEALARKCLKDHNVALAVILETKRKDFYIQFFDESAKPVSDPVCMNAENIEGCLDKYYMLTGDGVDRFFSLCAKPPLWSVDRTGLLPDPCIVAEIALERWNSGETLSPEPLYLRDADVSKPKKPLRTIAGTGNK